MGWGPKGLSEVSEDALPPVSSGNNNAKNFPTLTAL